MPMQTGMKFIEAYFCFTNNQMVDMTVLIFHAFLSLKWRPKNSKRSPNGTCQMGPHGDLFQF